MSMQLLDNYLNLQKQIHEYFGYVENWRVFPINDCRNYHWRLIGSGPGTVRFADTLELLLDEEKENYYENEIYTQRHLSKWVYRAKEYTMIVVDTHTDGNMFLSIFDNSKEYIRPHMQFEKMLTGGIPIKSTWVTGKF